MSWFDRYMTEWKEIIETVAREEHRSSQMVEKDTIQSMFLYMLSKQDLPFVFKGGTSLSKAYGLIDRFSEDIDLSMAIKPTESEKRKSRAVIMSIGQELGLAIQNPDDIQSRHSYNRYVFTFDSFFNETSLELIVETSYYQTVYPVEEHVVSSIVGEFCKKNSIILPIPFEASSFAMNVQTLERTFIDKVFAVCDYKIQDMQDRDSRHLYDIAKIIPHIEFTDDLRELVVKVRQDRMKSKNNPSAQPEYDISNMLMEIINSRFYESDYNTITRRLLYEDVSYDEAIKGGIAVVAKSNVF